MRKNRKNKMKAFDKAYPKVRCLICHLPEKETKTKRLVRDHNHKTGIIRGWLCDPCNGRLGKYEANIAKGRRGKGRRGKVFRWATKYQAEITEHLGRDTGILYSGKPYQPVGERKQRGNNLEWFCALSVDQQNSLRSTVGLSG